MIESKQLWTSAPVRNALFVGATLMAWTTTASMLVALKLAPLTRDARLTVYYPTVFSVLPWLAGCVFWFQVKKRTRLATADPDTATLCYRMILTGLVAAYLALFSIELVLIEVLAKAKLT